MDNNIAQNKKAGFEYFIEDSYECGIVLEGWEVKAAREKNVRVQEAYVKIVSGEVWLINASFSYGVNSSQNELDKLNTTKTRKLLLKKSEVEFLLSKTTRGGMTIVPLNMYWKKNKIKVKIALAKGKKMHDKRATLKEKDVKLEISRVMKNRRNT